MRQDIQETNLSNLAERLQSLHPANIYEGALLLHWFAGNEMQDPSFADRLKIGERSEAEHLAGMVAHWIRQPYEDTFEHVLAEYRKAISLVHTFCVQRGNTDASHQLERIDHALALNAPTIGQAVPQKRATKEAAAKLVLLILCFTIVLFSAVAMPQAQGHSARRSRALSGRFWRSA